MAWLADTLCRLASLLPACHHPAMAAQLKQALHDAQAHLSQSADRDRVLAEGQQMFAALHQGRPDSADRDRQVAVTG